MGVEGKYMPIKLNEHQQVFINALKTHGDWMRRDDLAQALGKQHLTPADVMTLDELESSGMLVKEMVNDSAPDGEAVRYRYSAPKAAVSGEEARS